MTLQERSCLLDWGLLMGEIFMLAHYFFLFVSYTHNATSVRHGYATEGNVW